MDEVTRRYEVENQLRSLRQSCDLMNGPMFSDDRVAVLGNFLRTCDSMMNGFESLCDGIEVSRPESKPATAEPIVKIPTMELWMNDDSFVSE